MCLDKKFLFIVALALLPSCIVVCAPQGVHIPTDARTGKKTVLKRARSQDMVQIEKQKPTTFWGKLKAGVTDLFVANEYISEITLAELKKSKDEAIVSKDRETALHFIEKLLPLCDELHDVRELTLQKADLLFELERYAKAEPVYRQYIDLYPGSENIGKVRHNLLMSMRKQMLSCDRDQTKTEETLKLAQEHSMLPECQSHSEEIQKIITECNLLLAERELYIANFYIVQKKPVTASRRLATARNDYLNKISQIEPHLLNYESLVAELQNDGATMVKKRYELVTKFPEHQVSITYLKQKPVLETLMQQLDDTIKPSEKIADNIILAQLNVPTFTERF
ncbi:MAG: outer membrane protein assembly factor BamD [Candidatus Dependentiae bacterium]